MTTASFWKADPSAWEDVVSALEGTTWPRGAAVLDVQWHVDQMKFGRPWPSSRDLAERWGWGRKKVRLLLQALDPLEQKGPAGAQRGPSRGPAGAKRDTVKPEESQEKGPAGAQQGPSRGPARATRAIGTENREQRTENRKEVVSPSADPSPPASRKPPAWMAGWESLARAWGQMRYRSYPEHGDPFERTHRAPPDPKVGQGKDLAALAKTHQPDRVLLVFAWYRLAPGAAYLRNSAEPRGLATIRRHFDKYLEHADEWDRRGRPGAREGPPRGSPRATPRRSGGDLISMRDSLRDRLRPEPEPIDIEVTDGNP